MRSQGASLNHLNQHTRDKDTWDLTNLFTGLCGHNSLTRVGIWPMLASQHLQHKKILWNLEMIYCCLIRLYCVCGPFSHSHSSLAEKCRKALHRSDTPWKWAFHTSASCALHDANEKNHTLFSFALFHDICVGAQTNAEECVLLMRLL